MSILEITEIISKIRCLPSRERMAKIGSSRPSVSPESFDVIKDALRKTLHVMIDLDFEDGRLDGAINSFLDAERFQISLTFNLNPNDVIFVRNLTRNEVTDEVLENIRKLRNRLS